MSNSSEGAPEPRPAVLSVFSVFIMGAGVVGTTLAEGLVRGGVPVVGLHGRQVQATDAISGVVTSRGDIPDVIKDTDVIIIAVRDERISEVAARLVDEQRLSPRHILLHTAGMKAAASVLAVARPHVRAVGTLHPLVSFADPRVAVEHLQDIAFGIEGDEPARAAAKKLVRAMGARAVVLEGEDLPLYHAGAVLASNYVVALVDMARRLLVTAGVPADEALPALIPLLSSVVRNLATVGLPGALTGPVQRGDVASVEQHVRALEARAPETLDLYRLLGRDVLRLARDKSNLDADTVERLEGLFATPR